MITDNFGALYAFIPFIIIGVALIATVALFVLDAAMTLELLGDIVTAMGSIWIIIVIVLLFVSFFCMEIHPIENFEETKETKEAKEAKSLLNKTEKEVCTMKDEVRKIIASNLGQAGQDDPMLIEKDMEVGSPTTVCRSTESPLTEDERLTRMETTLVKLAEPVLKKAYDTIMKCEGFAPYLEGFENSTTSTTSTLAHPNSSSDRLSVIQNKLRMLRSMYLDPLLQNQQDLQSGKLSDCNKRKAANAAIPGS